MPTSAHDQVIPIVAEAFPGAMASLDATFALLRRLPDATMDHFILLLYRLLQQPQSDPYFRKQELNSTHLKRSVSDVVDFLVVIDAVLINGWRKTLRQIELLKEQMVTLVTRYLRQRLVNRAHSRRPLYNAQQSSSKAYFAWFQWDSFPTRAQITDQMVCDNLRHYIGWYHHRRPSSSFSIFLWPDGLVEQLPPPSNDRYTRFGATARHLVAVCLGWAVLLHEDTLSGQVMEQLVLSSGESSGENGQLPDPRQARLRLPAFKAVFDYLAPTTAGGGAGSDRQLANLIMANRYGHISRGRKRPHY